MVMIVVSVFQSTTSCSTWGGDRSGDRSYEVGDNELTNWKTYLVVFLHNPLTTVSVILSLVTVGSAMCRELDSHRLHICLFQACALTTL